METKIRSFPPSLSVSLCLFLFLSVSFCLFLFLCLCLCLFLLANQEFLLDRAWLLEDIIQLLAQKQIDDKYLLCKC